MILYVGNVKIKQKSYYFWITPGILREHYTCMFKVLKYWDLHCISVLFCVNIGTSDDVTFGAMWELLSSIFSFFKVV